MRILYVRNVHDALPRALRLLDQEGIERPSRNGPVLLGPSVTTVYERPCERVLFWPTRDANPFFHLYEALWMLAGRCDIDGPARYAKQIREYSDDDVSLHGAYGYRWRHGVDQLEIIARRLRKNPDDRRCVLQMWSAERDLDYAGKDIPCNTVATFQRGINGELNLVVFCRSNDIVWGAYGANAVHFSFLLEYMALWISCPVGTYTQVSVNWHGYLSTLKQVETIRPDRVDFIENPYIDRRVHTTLLSGSIERVDKLIKTLLEEADADFSSGDDPPEEPWAQVVYFVLKAHHYWRTLPPPKRFTVALDWLHEVDDKADWIIAAREWIERRYYKWQMAQVLTGNASHQ